LSAAATTARATTTAEGRSAAATLTTQMISSAVCALTTLAFLLEAVWLAATANAAGWGWWPSSLGDPDSDRVPARRFVHVWQCKRGK
jgi:hypothetical protein